MLERRRFPRVKRKLKVKVRIVDQETKADITNDIKAHTLDISRGGLSLILPEIWDCPECNNCLGWVYNRGCKLKENYSKDDNRSFTPKLNLKISIDDPLVRFNQPVQLEGNIIWVNANTESKDNNCPVGVAFSQASQEEFPSDLLKAV